MNHAASPAELQDAWNHLHMHNMSDFFIFALGMAARTNPEAVKEALKDVFAPDAVAHMYRRAASEAREALDVARQANVLLEQVRKQLDDVEKRLDVIECRQERLKSGRAAG